MKKPAEGLITYICQYHRCGKTFTRAKLCGKRPRFCGDSCWESYRRYARPEGYWRVENPFAPRVFVCADCGRADKDSGAGPIPQRCSDCALDRDRESSNQWQKDNPERSRATKYAWAAANPEKVAESRERNKDAIAQSQREYQQRNRYKVLQWKRDREARRRVRKLSQPVEIFTSLEVFERDEWICGICFDFVDKQLCWPNPYSASLDHVIPISKGGSHTLDNVQCSHLGCNVRKSDSMPS